MTGAFLLILALLADGPETSTVSSYSVSISMSGDTLLREIHILGTAGSDGLLGRISRGFDPEFQSVELLNASFGEQGGETGPVPSWAVDTLSGSQGWPRSLVVAYPALRPGMTIEYAVLVRDWSPSWSSGPWALLSPSVKGIVPEETVFHFTDVDSYSLEFSGRGYTRSGSGGSLSFTADDSAGVLAVSPFSGWNELRDHLLGHAADMTRGNFPPDLREAALQATSAGADPYMQCLRVRTLLCNSFSLLQASRCNSTPRPLQEILDSRSATPLEMACVFSAICLELGMQSRIVPASSFPSAIPVPGIWQRYLVQAGSGGDSWLLEPSAFLTPADFIPGTDTLYLLLSDTIAVRPPSAPFRSRVTETWQLNPEEGTFRLTVSADGAFDGEIRRRFAGLHDDERTLAFSLWAWGSGRSVVPDSLSMPDPFDLQETMVLTAGGRFRNSGTADMLADLLPVLSWNSGAEYAGGITRVWRIRLFGRRMVHMDGEGELLGDTLMITRRGTLSAPVPFVLKTVP